MLLLRLTYTRRTQPQESASNKEYMASLGLYRMFDVVKLVDTPASGAGDRKVVEVRVFSWAPNSDQTRESGFFRFRSLIFKANPKLFF